MARPLMLDTNMLVDYQRQREEAVAYVDQLTGPPLLPAVVVGELYAGVRDGEEREALDNFVRVLPVVPLTAQIVVTGGLYRRQYGKSHNTGFNDAMIAATAQAWQAALVTLNQRHFPMLEYVVTPW